MPWRPVQNGVFALFIIILAFFFCISACKPVICGAYIDVTVAQVGLHNPLASECH